MLALIKRAAHSSARALGFQISRLPSPHIPWGHRFHEVLTRAEPMVVQIDIRRTRWKAGRVSFDSRHPFTLSVQRAAEVRSPIPAIREVLEAYYRLVQPTRCSDIIESFGMQDDAFSLARHNVPWPWDTQPASRDPDRTPFYDGDAIVFGSSQAHGVQHWGPVSKQKLDTEVRKLADLLISIEQRGYVVEGRNMDSFIRGYIMRNREDWACVITQGQHRVAVLSALGYDKVPVYITRVVDYIDLPYFPKITAGVYSLDEASELFGRMIIGEPIPALSPWLESSFNLGSSG